MQKRIQLQTSFKSMVGELYNLNFIPPLSYVDESDELQLLRVVLYKYRVRVHVCYTCVVRLLRASFVVCLLRVLLLSCTKNGLLKRICKNRLAFFL
jgi:hypothetical protein